MTIKVDKGKKMPPVHQPQSGRPNKYPFEKMKIGDSFFSGGINTRHSIYSSLRNYNSNFQTKVKIKISIRQEDNGVRVWRIK